MKWGGECGAMRGEKRATRKMGVVHLARFHGINVRYGTTKLGFLDSLDSFVFREGYVEGRFTRCRWKETRWGGHCLDDTSPILIIHADFSPFSPESHHP